MAGLPWVRLDSNIATHDKILDLLQDREGVKGAWLYVCSLAYCGGHGTDGSIPFQALPFIHGTKRLAEMLVKRGLWIPVPDGWAIPKWAERQQTTGETRDIRVKQSVGAVKGNCIRWHGPDCHCWKGAI